MALKKEMNGDLTHGEVTSYNSVGLFAQCTEK